ncbi:hypothetical protein BWZ20_09345 [Winogradskyella sp. J14-2]|uniref:hypothetical protein n=1 Tax=Winogradskyella sp. J14-2 TaxID=1936080 RepID=UPI0009729A9A|nr:hypothetical protein [Winogradskyella sp. J14-2]APY08491.1 hypothetical protein BWZ20_09345 [Winogradskyella sp. J14-2]
MLNIAKTYGFFYASILFGVFIWLFSFLILPAKAVEVFKLETALFILTCYTTLILGFTIVSFKTVDRYKEINSKRLINFLTFLLVICFLLRWVDLFGFRKVSFFNDSFENRRLSKIHSDTNIIFILASILKSLYFFPFVIHLKLGFKKRIASVAAIIILFFPLVEALLYGTRKPYFEIAIIIFISLLLFRKIKLKIFNIFAFLTILFLLMTVSYKVMLKRETERSSKEDIYKVITTSRYNDLLKPNKEVIGYLNNPNVNVNKKNYTLILLQTGQYINHGVFEFNHILNTNLPTTYGQYTLYPFFKFFAKTITKNNYENFNPSPRKYVYLSAFGSFYIDFKWASIIIFFLLGIIQKYFHKNYKGSLIHSPMVIYLAIINIFLPILNYLRGAGIYPLIGFSVILIFCHFFIKRINEKSTDT